MAWASYDFGPSRGDWRPTPATAGSKAKGLLDSLA
ncbi:creatinine amidohydrolase, partial [Klebsiella pneumoniae]